MAERDPGEIFEKYSSIRERFRDDFEFAVAPLRADARANYEGALKFADSGIRALFGLNGGGLIALPAFAALFKTDMHAAAVWIVCAVAMFVVGFNRRRVDMLVRLHVGDEGARIHTEHLDGHGRKVRKPLSTSSPKRRLARADGDAAAHQAGDVLRSGHRGCDCAARANSG